MTEPTKLLGIPIKASTIMPERAVMLISNPPHDTVEREKLPTEDYVEFLLRTNRVHVIENLEVPND